MDKVKVSTIEELENARKNKIGEIVVTGELISTVKRATTLKKVFYWLIIVLLFLGINFMISSKILDFYSIFQLNSIGIKRSLGLVLAVLLAAVLFIFGIKSSKVSSYKLSYIDRFFKGNDYLSLYKVWYFWSVKSESKYYYQIISSSIALIKQVINNYLLNTSVLYTLVNRESQRYIHKTNFLKQGIYVVFWIWN